MYIRIPFLDTWLRYRYIPSPFSGIPKRAIFISHWWKCVFRPSDPPMKWEWITCLVWWRWKEEKERNPSFRQTPWQKACKASRALRPPTVWFPIPSVLVRRVGKVIPVCYRFYDSRTIFSRDLPRESKATTYNPPRSARPTPVAKLGWASCVNSRSEASEVPQTRLAILLTPFFISYPKLPQRWWVSSGKAQGGRGEGAIVGDFDILTFAAFEDDKNRGSSWPRTEKKMWQDSGLTLFLT